MLIRRQDISVVLLYYFGYSRIRNIILCLQRKPITRFVTFHDISPDALKYFKVNLYFLKRYTNVLSLDDFFSGKLSSDKINVVITFDDGYKSWITYAVPVLKKLELPAIFFVSSGFVGLSKEREAEFMRSRLFIKSSFQRITGGLSIEDMKKIVEDGFTVGGHTLNHCNLAELHNIAKLRFEIAEDKVRLERLTGRNIEYFAYPSGKYLNPKINLTEVLRELGYRGAVSTLSGFNTFETNPYLLHRELTYAAMPSQVFKARVYGNYDAVRFLKQLFNWVPLRP